MAEINSTILDLSGRVAGHFKIEKSKDQPGKATGVVDEHVFVASAPEGITSESIALHKEYQDNFMIAAEHAAGMAANEFAKKHKGIEEVSFSFPISGRDKFTTEWSHNKQVPDGIGKDAGTKTVYGHMTRGATAVAIKSSSGQMKAVLAAVSENARELLG